MSTRNTTGKPSVPATFKGAIVRHRNTKTAIIAPLVTTNCRPASSPAEAWLFCARMIDGLAGWVLSEPFMPATKRALLGRLGDLAELHQMTKP